MPCLTNLEEEGFNALCGVGTDGGEVHCRMETAILGEDTTPTGVSCWQLTKPPKARGSWPGGRCPGKKAGLGPGFGHGHVRTARLSLSIIVVAGWTTTETF